MSDPGEELRDTLRSICAEVPASQAENDGWPQRAMPAMLAELGLSEAPTVGWFVAAINPLYDKATPQGWRYCNVAEDPSSPDLLGIAYGGSSPAVYLRADVSLPRCIQTLGHELWHVAEFARGEPADEEAADAFGASAAAAFWRSTYR